MGSVNIDIFNNDFSAVLYIIVGAWVAWAWYDGVG